MEGVEIRDEPGTAQWHLRKPHWEWKTPPGRALVAYIPEPLCPTKNGAAAVLRLFRMHGATPGGTILQCYGVGGVYTAEHFRWRGLASALLTEADAWGRDHGASILALYAVYGRDLYLRAGYVPVAQANEREHLWIRVVDPGLAPLPGPWKIWPDGGHF